MHKSKLNKTFSSWDRYKN